MMKIEGRFATPTTHITSLDPSIEINQKLLGMEISMLWTSRILKRKIRIGRCSSARAKSIWYADLANHKKRIHAAFKWYCRAEYPEWQSWFYRSINASEELILKHSPCSK